MIPASFVAGSGSSGRNEKRRTIRPAFGVFVN